MLKVRKQEWPQKRLRGFFICLLFISLSLGSCAQDPSPATHHGIHKGAGSIGIHTILEKDTLYSISKHYKLPMRDLIKVNKLAPPYRLNVGQRLKLPPPREYIVQGGDTLHSVSQLFDVSTSEIVRLNNLSDPYKIYDGQALHIPPPIEKPKPIIVANQSNKEINPTAQNTENLVSPGHKPSTKIQKKPIKLSSQTPARSSNRFLKPVQGKTVSSYGSKSNGLHNDGINIAAARGTAVKAAENGVVVYVGNDLKGTGNLVLIRHADRWMSAYAHLGDTAVERGQVLKRGAKIGTVGSSGSVDSPQLHFELRRGTKALNPKAYMEG